MTKVSLTSQIAAVQAAAEGKVFTDRSVDRLQREHLQAAFETLKWLKVNETEIRAFIDAKRRAA